MNIIIITNVHGKMCKWPILKCTSKEAPHFPRIAYELLFKYLTK